jgi:3-dehydroquinate synthase
MIAAVHMAVDRGLCDATAADRVRSLLERLGLPTRWEGLDADEIWRIMQHDKKARGGRVRMVLPTRLGSVDVFDDVAVEQVRSAVAAIS